MATFTSSFDKRRDIIGEEVGPANTIGDELARSVERDGDRVHYIKADGEQVTSRQFAQLCRNVARSCISLGVQKNEGVGILGFNSLQWFAADVGATLATALPVGIYTTSKPHVVKYVLEKSAARIVFVDNQDALLVILSIKAECPKLENIIFWGDVDLEQFSDHYSYVYSWQEFLEMGDPSFDKDVSDRLSTVVPEDCCKLIYTSGTTGLPKAVMISHANLTSVVHSIQRLLNISSSDRVVSFLPCSHIAANMIDIVGPIMLDFTVYIARPDALRGSLVTTLCQVRPTLFLAVPRVWEKMRDKMLEVGAKRGAVSRFIAAWAKDIGMAACLAEENNTAMPFGVSFAQWIVFGNVRKALGLDQARIFVNSAAPLQKTTDDYFRSLRIKIMDLFGATEATGPLTVNMPNAYKRGTSGKSIPGVEVKVVNPDKSGEGELCFRGRNIFMGYLGQEEESGRTIDGDGFYHTGDLGRVDEDGFVTITGRLKELLVTAGGENVAPLLVESSILEAMPAICRAFAIGDKRRFVSCLLIPYMNDKGELQGASAAVNPSVTTAQEAVGDATWKTYLDQGVEEANKHAISNAAKVRKYRLLERDFSVDGGELTPTLKVKRKVVLEKYDALISEIY